MQISARKLQTRSSEKNEMQKRNEAAGKPTETGVSLYSVTLNDRESFQNAELQALFILFRLQTNPDFRYMHEGSENTVISVFIGKEKDYFHTFTSLSPLYLIVLTKVLPLKSPKNREQTTIFYTLISKSCTSGLLTIYLKLSVEKCQRQIQNHLKRDPSARSD